MSYSGMGIAIPGGRGVSARSVAVRNVASIGRSLMGLGAPAPSQGSAIFDPLDAAARAAIAAVNSASAAALASSAGIAAVRAFQAAYGNGLVVDGRYGTRTRAALLTVIPGATLPGGSASTTSSQSSMTTPYVDSGAAIDPVTAAAITEAEARPAWVIPALTVGGVVLLGTGLLLMQRGRLRLRSNRLRRNRRS